MYLRCGFLVIADPADSEKADAVLEALPRLLGGGGGSFLPLTRRVYLEPPRYQVEETLRQWSDEEELDLILTVGGTFPAPGPSAGEIVPEATAEVLERLMPSLPERMRSRAAATNPAALLDRGVAGIRGRTLIVNLPGGEGLTAMFLESILDVIPHVAARLAADGGEAGANLAPLEPARTDSQPESKSLDREEFAAFLRRRKEDA